MKKFKLFQPFLLLLLFLVSCETQSTIIYNISEKEANEIVVLLNSKGIPAVKTSAPSAAGAAVQTEQLWNISVPGELVTQAVAILNQSGLPRKKETTLLDLFAGGGLVPSDLQDRIRYQEGLADQLTNTIRKMEGVIDANVQLSFPQGEEGQKKEMAASVYVKHRGILDNLNSPLIIKIKRLVASAVPGLKIENVTVVADRALLAEITYPPPEKEGELGEVVSVWGIYLSAQSLTRFRVIFYLFLTLIFILFSITIWMGWKFSHLIMKKGWRFILELEPYKEGIEEEKKEEIIP